ncbi:hypothetical protein [Flavobacterium cyclinae]|uniref:hypothetical protein n=1 Tax=Flavobacterium cyclinae TaxID=2895947 RepID=UPI001E63877D|nr:hypothetical protein [Flavobacterium cyclinae]UGS19918.1 hypothetical protein LOS86_07760 [Flavobacterium cyclinae]
MKKVYLFLFLIITLGLNAQSVEMLTIKCYTTATKIDLSTYMDTYYEENYVNPDKEMTKAFDPVFFGDTSNRMSAIVLTIFCSTRGELITGRFRNEQIQPKDNEIIFLFEIENTGNDISTQKIYFKVGGKVQESIHKKTFDYNKLLTFLKCTVFKNDYFPEDLVSYAYIRANKL